MNEPLFEQLSPVLLHVNNKYYGGPRYLHWCEGCAEEHAFAVEAPQSNGARWTFDGNDEWPTFTPSMNIKIGPTSQGKFYTCHYNLIGGKIFYHQDTTHKLRGQTIDLKPFPEISLNRLRNTR